MAKPKKPDDYKPHDDKDGYDEPQGPGTHHGGDPVRIHEDYVRHHMSGGDPATPEAYERAMEQFRRLPGAVRVRTPHLKPGPDKSEPEGEEPEEPQP